MKRPTRSSWSSAALVDDAARIGSAGVRATGSLVLDPPLDPGELAFLAAFCESRRWTRPGGPYDVPSNPLAECVDPNVDLAAFSRPAAGQPSLVCAWLPAGPGSALVPRAVVTSADEVVAWLRYLREHFLGPGIPAARAAPGVPRFRRHLLVGAVAITDDETGALEAVIVRGSDLTRVRLHPPREGRRSA